MHGGRKGSPDQWRKHLATSASGRLAGAALLLVTPAEIFLGAVPWLLLAATLVFAAGPILLELARRSGAASTGPVASATAIFAVSIYGGYFNGGLGTLLLAVFGLIGFRNLHGMNGLKNILSAVLSVVSAVTCASAGLIAWEEAGVLALATAASSAPVWRDGSSGPGSCGPA